MAGLSGKMLGLVRRKEDDDGFFRAQSHVAKQYDQVGTRPSKLRRNPLTLTAEYKLQSRCAESVNLV